MLLLNYRKGCLNKAQNNNMYFFSLWMSIEETCIDLSQAIEAGDMQSASVLAATLARQHVALQIQASARDYEDDEIRCGSWFFWSSS